MATFDNYKRPSQKTTPASLKARILENLPKGFKCSVSKTGATVQIWVDVNKVGGWDKANRLVYSLAKKLKLNEVGAGTNLDTMVRDWEFIDTTNEKQMVNEAKDVLKTMKSFFKKYGNAYCDSNDCYKVIDQMRALVETDEN